jgi:hypothetical protein
MSLTCQVRALAAVSLRIDARGSTFLLEGRIVKGKGNEKNCSTL